MGGGALAQAQAGSRDRIINIFNLDNLPLSITKHYCNVLVRHWFHKFQNIYKITNCAHRIRVLVPLFKMLKVHVHESKIIAVG